MTKYYTNLTAKKLKELEQIAMTASYSLNERGGIDMRHNDREDFPEIPFDDYMKVTKSRPFKWKFIE